MWHALLTQPLTAKIIALSALALVALWAWLKKRVISAASSTTWNALKLRFWRSAEKNLARVREPTETPVAANANEKTYVGIFVSYNQYEAPPREWFFQIISNGLTITVPVMKTNLFSGIPYGAVVAIETLRGVYLGTEIVQTVSKRS